jgi:uncharacterized protein (TIGR03032 family)
MESEALRSVHTSNLPNILLQLRSSLLITTYQAGKLVIVRKDGDVVNTHFRTLQKPMGMAVAPDRVAIGTAQEIWEFRSIPAVARRIKPEGKHDAAFLPRVGHVTGDIQIHEMHYFNNELWFVNTVFSCLCTVDRDHSFVPRWRPKFVTNYAPGDRCHLNGLGAYEGRPRFVTALGETNAVAGWRENKKNGGLLIDMDSDEVIMRGLSMPHSPRWYQNRLWLLESGSGSFGYVDLQTCKYETVCQFPGFTRGLDFIGNLAVIGLSQVRETAVFSGIAITERLTETERICGVWLVDIHSGQTVAFLKFEEAVQEIFAVSILRGALFPDFLTDDTELIGSSYVLPDEALEEVPNELRSDLPVSSAEPVTFPGGEIPSA